MNTYGTMAPTSASDVPTSRANGPRQLARYQVCSFVDTLTSGSFIPVAHSLLDPQTAEHKHGSEGETGDHGGDRTGPSVAGGTSDKTECAHLQMAGSDKSGSV